MARRIRPDTSGTAKRQSSAHGLYGPRFGTSAGSSHPSALCTHPSSPSAATGGCFGAIFGRSLLAEASTPLYRTVWKRGYGTAAARRHSSDSGSTSIAMVPSENARFSVIRTRPSLPGTMRSCATAGRRMYLYPFGYRDARAEPLVP
jgi:hypothetical protein